MGTTERLLSAVCVAASLVSTAGCGTLEAQEERSRLEVSLGLRWDHFANQDRLVSPRRHDGTGLSRAGLGVSVKAGASRHSVAIWLGSLPLSADDGFAFSTTRGVAQIPESEVTLGEASYTYVRNVSLSGWGLGASAGLKISHSEYDFGSGSAEAFLYMGSLDLVGERRVELGAGRRLTFSLQTPLFSWVARPTASTVDEARLQSSNDFFHRMGRGEFGLPGRVKAVWTHARYQQMFTRRISLWTAARVGVLRHTEQGHYTEVQASLDFGGAFRWGGGVR